MRVRWLAAALALCAIQAGAQIPDLGVNASLRGKRVLPAGNPWNQDISGLPVDPASDTILATVGWSLPFNLSSIMPGGAPIPYIIVGGSQPKVGITFSMAGESDKGPYPIPPNPPIEGGPAATGDRHVLVLDRDNGKLYEIFRAFPDDNGPGWWGVSGAIFDLNSNAVRPAGWTSADAAGLPIFPGLIRFDEVSEEGEITHALRVTVPETSRAYLFPARHFASKLQNKNLPPMGLRVRLKDSFDISGYPAEAQVILRALKKYGMLVADNAARRLYWELICTDDPRWNDEALRTINQLRTSDLEVVQRGVVEPVFERLALAAPSIVGGLPMEATVTLRGPAPPGGLDITVSSDQAAVMPDVASIHFNPGETVGRFTLRTRAVATQTTAFVRVHALEYAEPARLIVNPVTVKSAVISPSSVIGGAAATATVTLRAPAGPGPLTIDMKSNHAAAQPSPTKLVIPEGKTTGMFTVHTTPVAANVAAILSAALNGVSVTAKMTVKSPTLLSIQVAPASARGSTPRTGTITLSGPAPAGSTTVALSSASSLITYPSSITLPAGSVSATFSIQTSIVPSRASASLTAKHSTVARSATITLTP